MGLRILVLDNYDSFTYNLVQYIGESGAEPMVYRNDAITLDKVKALAPHGIVISPGPGTPEDPRYFGVCAATLKEVSPEVPTLGVCLGLQGMAHVYGGKVVHAKALMHGKSCMVKHTGKGVLQGLPNPMEAGRYHSLVVHPELPPDLELTAWTDDGEVMGARHKRLPIEGVQFHPESILTPQGKALVANFLEACR